MPQSLKGDTGVNVSTILNDKVTIVGDHANLNPTHRVDPTGHEINNYSISESSGMTQTKSSIPKYTALDNAGDFHGGTYTTTVMNSLNYEVANGGINMNTGGNLNLSSWGGLLNITSSTQASITSDVVMLNCTNTAMVNGPTLYVNADETIFDKNVTFGNNIMVNGGAAINGELMAAHITTQRQTNFTEECDDLLGYPMMGAQLQCMITPTAPMIIPGVPIPCMVVLTPMAPNPIVSVPGHNHVFEGPACTLTDGVTGIFAEMKSAEGSTPVQAKPAQPMDKPTGSLVSDMTGGLMKKATKFISDLIGM